MRACFRATAQNCVRSTQLSSASRKTQCQPPTSLARSEPKYQGTAIRTITRLKFYRSNLRRVIDFPASPVLLLAPSPRRSIKSISMLHCYAPQEILPNGCPSAGRISFLLFWHAVSLVRQPSVSYPRSSEGELTTLLKHCVLHTISWVPVP